MHKTMLVIGAAGDVGQGIVRMALAEGWTIVAAGRDAAKIEQVCAQVPSGALHGCIGDVASEEGAEALWNSAIDKAGQIDAVVMSVNAPNRIARLIDWTGSELSDLLNANLLTHFNVAKVMLPRLPEQGVLLGIGGGTADFVIPTMAPLSMAQAALRMLYRGLARERGEVGAQVRELMIISMVNGASKRDKAQPEWVTDDDVGRHVCAILARPDEFRGPIVQLKTREQVGQPEPAPKR